MSRKNDSYGKDAPEIVEEAVHLLRTAPVSVVARYYIGTLPFILGLLYFWAVMSRSSFADTYCTSASLGVALLFIWMKVWHTFFAHHLKAILCHEPPPSASLPSTLRTMTTQAIMHSTGLIALPLASLLLVPFGWVYAFYQNVCVLDDGKGTNLNDICRNAWTQALLWPGQNHFVLIILSFFGLFVAVNVGMAIYGLPYLLKTLLGIETQFTMSGPATSILNTTFFATTFSITYLCVDPLVKAVYAIRCFYGASLKTGDDLRADLTAINLKQATLALFIVVLFSLVTVQSIQAVEPNPSYTDQVRQTHLSVMPEDLDRSIRDILQQKDFTWRTPEDENAEEQRDLPGPIATIVEWISYAGKTIFNTLNRWIDIIYEWLKRLMPEHERASTDPKNHWMGSVRVVLVVLFAALAGVVLFYLWRLWHRRHSYEVKSVAEATPATPNLADDTTTAEELPVDRWVALGRNLLAKGDLRLALRAFYFATLAHLADNDFLTIAKYKSNRDYVLEFQRRAHQHHDALTAFSHNVTLFDASWYGMHDVTHDMVTLFTTNHERIVRLGE